MLTLIILIAFPFLIWRAWKNLRLARESANWPSAPGVITESESANRRWRVAYTYSVEGADYTGTGIVVGAKPGGKSAAAILARYPLGSQVTVHYPPGNPKLAVLEPGPNPYVTAIFRTYIYYFVVLMGINVALYAVNRWTASRTAENPEAPTYDSVANDSAVGDRLIQQGADAGDAKDEGYVGAWYLGGLEGYTKDPAKAAEWFKKSAEQGDAGSQTLLGELYVSGNGVPKDWTQAVGWFQKAAAQNNTRACAALGMAYEKGAGGLPKDPQQAITWYKAAGDDPLAKKGLERLGAQ